MKKVKKFLPLIVIVILSLIAWYFGLYKYFSFEKIREHLQVIELYVHAHQILSVLIFAGLYVIVVVLSLPVATFMTITAGILFGQILGTSCVVISATIGATLLFISTKMASSGLMQKKAGPWIKKMQAGFKENALSYLLTLRLIPLFPFFAINIVAALLQIPLRTFFFGTLFGIIPGSFVYVSIGVALQDVIKQPNFSAYSIAVQPKILIALTGLGILSLLPVLYKRFHQNR